VGCVVGGRVGQLVLGFLWATRNFDFGTPGTFFELITKPQFDFKIFIFLWDARNFVTRSKNVSC